MEAKKNIYSMTGYGRQTHVLDEYSVQLEIEIKSLNSRYLDLNIKLPRILSEHEFAIRQLLGQKITRGKVDCSISLRPLPAQEKAADAKLDQQKTDYIRAKIDNLQQIYLSLGVVFSDTEKAAIINRCLQELSEEASSKTAEFSVIKPVILNAIESFLVSRKTEGDCLVSDMQQRISSFIEIVKTIELRLTNQPQILKDRLQGRLEKIISPAIEFDQGRLLQEVALLVDRSDVSEELIRLNAHLKSFLDTLLIAGQVGKKLDFFCQEIFRELNTLGNKVADAEIQAKVVNCKVELEKIREQVQNLE